MIGRQTIPTSFSEFVAEVEPRLRTALCASFGPEQGRDSAAEALAYGWEHWDRVRAMPNPAGYLWGVGRNHARRASRRRHAFVDVPANAAPWVEPGLPSALADLSEKQRIAVTLVHGLDWSLSEVADLLGVSKSTVQTQTERGMKKLRNSLGVEQ
jgi:RNA polymerase sigma-70 factor (ECF subfamily)